MSIVLCHVFNVYYLIPGGVSINRGPSNVVDMFSTTTGKWSTDKVGLKEPRYGMAAASIKELAMFAGGLNNSIQASQIIEIYNITSDSWSRQLLVLGRNEMSAVTVGSQVCHSTDTPTYVISSQILNNT